MSAMDLFDTCHSPQWDFVGPPGSFTATAADNSPWRIADTSSAGTPTYVLGNTGSDIGALTLTFDNTSEIQNVCVYQSDFLQFDIDDLIRFECRVKMGQASVDSATTLSFGLISARNDAHTAATAVAAFSVVGGTSTTVVYAETDDNVTDTAPVSTGKTLINAYKTFAIDFSNGKSDVRFYIDGQPVCVSTTFTMAGYSSGLQCYLQLQKTADTNTDAVTIDYFRIVARRPIR